MSGIFVLKDKVLKKRRHSSDDFNTFLNVMKTDIRHEITQNDQYFEMNRRALTGDKEAIAYFYQEIDKYLRLTPFSGEIPNAYKSPVEALFHEWKGFGSAHQWFTDPKYSDSTGLQIIGTEIYYNYKGKFHKFPYKMPNLNRVDHLKRTLLSSDEKAKANREKPQEEFKMLDPLWPGRFIRLAMWVYPRTWEDFPTISLRRQVVEHLTLSEQVGTGVIPGEAEKFVNQLVLLKQNIVVAGPVNSGKTTFANTIVGTQLDAANQCMGVVMIEKHPESILPYVYKDHRIIPVMAKDEELMEVGIESLRHDPSIIFMTEMRYSEWQFFLFAGTKGYDSIIGTFHTDDAEDIPYQAAHAVYTELGGSMKGHLISALKSTQLVFIMKCLSNGEKRLTRISEICIDEVGKSVYANDLMRHDPVTDTWTYNAAISLKQLLRMEQNNSNSFHIMIDELKRLAKQKPMKDPLVYSERSRVVLNE